MESSEKCAASLLFDFVKYLQIFASIILLTIKSAMEGGGDATQTPVLCLSQE